ncbi:hypothetical protein GOODEAATRI_009618 [Goodea atripinnis]|uniref:Protein FAM184A/B N-terminal domain-containing protein n=1 Tax=Goodea atripinnis TaxID=208336 RepID=A0ABV0MRA9_9TELE
MQLAGKHLYAVIYALNTKNDEHEAAIATLKEAHEEEVQQILSETREKILQSKISDEMDLKKRIQSLEESMELHDRMKRQALAEFESYRQRVEDMQLCTEAQVHGGSVCLGLWTGSSCVCGPVGTAAGNQYHVSLPVKL